MLKFVCSLCLGVLLVMGHAVFAQESPSDQSGLFPDEEPPFYEDMPVEFPEYPDSPEESPSDESGLFPDEEPPFYEDMPVEFPEDPDYFGESTFEQSGPFPDEESSLFPDLPPDEFQAGPDYLADSPAFGIDLFGPPPVDPNPLFASPQPRVIEYVMPPPIPPVPVDGDLTDGLEKVLQAGLDTVKDDLITQVQEQVQEALPNTTETATEMVNQLGDFATEHPILAGTGASLLAAAADKAANAGLEEYGDYFNANSLKIPLPKSPGVVVYWLGFPVQITITGGIVINAFDQDSYMFKINATY